VDRDADASALAARVLRSDPTVGAVRLVCIDGPAGAGKTSLAARLVAALEPLVGVVPVVRGDDVYEGWAVVEGCRDRVDAFAALGPQLLTWLVQPWELGRPGSHPVWDWYAGSWGASRSVPAAAVVVLEGVGLAGAALRERATLAAWVDTRGNRLHRVLERDGDALREEMLEWQRDEQRWFARDATRAGCTVRLTT
jgi:uridine kinase